MIYFAIVISIACICFIFSISLTKAAKRRDELEQVLLNKTWESIEKEKRQKEYKQTGIN